MLSLWPVEAFFSSFLKLSRLGLTNFYPKGIIKMAATDSSAVSSVSDRNRLSPQDRSRQLLTAVWHHSHAY